MPIVSNIVRIFSRSCCVTREPLANALAARPMALGVFVRTRMIRAVVTFSICAMRIPAANDTTNFFPIVSPSSRKTGSTICGFKPKKIISAFLITSALSVITEMCTWSCSCARVSAFGSLARIAFALQNFFSSNPRMTDPASLPAPMKPRMSCFTRWLYCTK